MMERVKFRTALVQSSLAALCLLVCCYATAQGLAPELPLPSNKTPSGAAQPATDSASLSAAPAPSVAQPAAAEPPSETCRSMSDKAMAADMKALTAQAQKQDVATLVQLHSASAGLWTKAVELCDGRAKERAQRNLAESQKANALFNQQLGDGPECAAAHKDAVTLQDMARAALAERRWEDAATLFHKSEDMWDLATERCTGPQKELAGKRQEQSEIDGFNAEHCAPLFERAREQTQKLRASSAGMSREDKQDGSMLAETLWRDALAQCKGSAAQDSARNNAQALARERGTPWVARNPATALAAKPAEAGALAKSPAPPSPATASASANIAVLPAAANNATSVATTANKLSPSLPPAPSLTNSATAVGSTAAPVAPVATTEAAKPQAQPAEFSVGDMRFKGQFVRDADTPTYSGNGTLSWANGDIFEGTLQNGKRQGKGLFIWGNGQRYRGDWINDISTGQATVDFTNGDHYEGAVENASPTGLGSMRYASGDTYRGSFLSGIPNGSGVYVWKNGQRFEGEWKNGKPNGQGTLTFAHGDRYEGTLKDGQPDQHGSFTWTSGDRFTGEWKAGKKNGQGVFTWASGDRWDGIYQDDVQTANGTLIRKSP